MDDKTRLQKVQEEIDALIKKEENGSELTSDEAAKRFDLINLYFLLREQNWKQTGQFINDCLVSLSLHKRLSTEVVQFVFEKLEDAYKVADANPKARNNPIASALYLAGRQPKWIKHLAIAEEICEESFKYRHRPDPIDRAVKSLAHKYLDEKYTLAIVNKYKISAMTHIATFTDDPQKRDYFQAQLNRTKREEASTENGGNE